VASLAPVPPPDLAPPDEHPGTVDPAYRARRDRIAAVAAHYQPGDPLPEVAYTAEEDEVWRLVSSELRDRHERLASAAYREGVATLDLPRDRVPQLAEVSARLGASTGFALQPVPGLVPTRTFYGALADRRFLSTQYVRHPSVPLYTPEPDVIHEVIGHANGLASPALADLYQAAGAASRRATTDAALEFFSRVFWFTIEFGVVWEGGELRTYGAGILSSVGELDAFRGAARRPFDIPAMGRQDYDITHFQPVLFAAPSFATVVDELGAFFEAYDDDAYERLSQGAAGGTTPPPSRGHRR
jgi:phenylalanine-4-hydroxylase